MLHTLALFALTEFIFCLTPGPAVFLTVSQSIRNGFVAGLVVALGVVTTNIFYFILLALGVGAALASSPAIFMVLKYCGAAYLAYTAFMTIRDLWRQARNPDARNTSHAIIPKKNLRDAFFQALLMQASNLKNLVIFVAIIPQFIDASQSTQLQFAALGAVSVAVELPVLAGYAALASRFAGFIRANGYQNYLDGLSAAVLLAIAGTLVVN
jgi:homoserine/homoserine lactone efflux protein